MTTIIFNSTHDYHSISKLFDQWVFDISSEEVHIPFHDYWNSRFDSPKLDDCAPGQRYKLTFNSPKLDDCAPGQRYRLTFNSEQERTFWLLKNS